MTTVLIVITAALIALGVAGYFISSSQVAQQRRKARVKLLQQIVRHRFESMPDYNGDRRRFDQAMEQAPALFGSSGAVLVAFQRFRDAEVSGADPALKQHHLTELLREMCRDVGIDAASIREELPLRTARASER